MPSHHRVANLGPSDRLSAARPLGVAQNRRTPSCPCADQAAAPAPSGYPRDVRHTPPAKRCSATADASSPTRQGKRNGGVETFGSGLAIDHARPPAEMAAWPNRNSFAESAPSTRRTRSPSSRPSSRRFVRSSLPGISSWTVTAETPPDTATPQNDPLERELRAPTLGHQPPATLDRGTAIHHLQEGRVPERPFGVMLLSPRPVGGIQPRRAGDVSRPFTDPCGKPLLGPAGPGSRTRRLAAFLTDLGGGLAVCVAVTGAQVVLDAFEPPAGSPRRRLVTIDARSSHAVEQVTQSERRPASEPPQTGQRLTLSGAARSRPPRVRPRGIAGRSASASPESCPDSGCVQG